MCEDLPLRRRPRRNRHVLALKINESGAYDYVDAVRSAMKRAESDTSDPEVTQALVSFEHRLTRTSDIAGDLATTDLDDVDELVDTE